MTINSVIVSLIKPAVFALFGLMAGACAQAPVKTTATIPKVDISALPFPVQPLVPVHPADAAMQTGAADLESTEQAPPTVAATTVSEDVPIETSTPDSTDHSPLPTSLTSLPKIAVTEQTRASPGNIVETPAETAAGTAAGTAAAVSASAAEEQSQPIATPDTATESTQAPETPTLIDDIVTGSGAEKTSTSSVEALPEPVSNTPVSRQNLSGQNSGQSTMSFADSAYDGCKIIRIYGSYISVSVTRNGTEALLVSLDLPKEYNSLQTMVNYIAYADFEPASYYPYKDETPTKIAELIRNGKVQCVLQES